MHSSNQFSFCCSVICHIYKSSVQQSNWHAILYLYKCHKDKNTIIWLDCIILKHFLCEREYGICFKCRPISYITRRQYSYLTVLNVDQKNHMWPVNNVWVKVNPNSNYSILDRFIWNFYNIIQQIRKILQKNTDTVWTLSGSSYKWSNIVKLSIKLP